MRNNMDFKKSAAAPAQVPEVCAICGAKTAILEIKNQQFAYRDGSSEVPLIAEVPVMSCSTCGETYTAPGAEEAQHAAVCRYLNRLTPGEIKALRKRNGWSQQELAEATGIGIASIKRWESGVVIQNASLDATLRSADQQNMQAAEKPRPTPRFRTNFSEDALESARRFQLRPRTLQAA
jgi:putative zinc finger/helix-turn-helix YgiT family protein